VKLLIVVASVTGRTRRMAEAAAGGAREAGAQVLVRRAEEAQEADLLEADAVLLASAVHMGGVASSMRAFCERMAHLWLQGRLVGKLGAALVSAGDGERGGGELALVSLLANLAEHGMLLVPMHNRLAGYRAGGCHWGPLAHTNPADAGPPGPTPPQLEAARSHGRWLAECTARWLRGAASF
jgi:NAD(P)H dehydrogenase (quinone)